jgi:hypothetical protein
MGRHMEDQQRVADSLAHRPLLTGDSDKWSLSLNPEAVLEPQTALGFGIGYQFTQSLQLWLESSALCQMYKSPNQSVLGGFREILALKFYFGPRQSLFAAGEFRWKQVWYHDVANFYSPAPAGIPAPGTNINNYTYTLENTVFGGAAWFGGRIRLSNDHRLRLELSIGLGIKGRTVAWQGVPKGWQYQGGPSKIDIFSTSPRDNSPALPYIPAAVRLVYVL